MCVCVMKNEKKNDLIVKLLHEKQEAEHVRQKKDEKCHFILYHGTLSRPKPHTSLYLKLTAKC